MGRLLVAVSRTAPVSRDAAYETCSAFSERPSRARLRAGNPARERPAFRERPSRGRLKCRRVLMEFGTRGFPCARGHVSGASRAAYRVFCSRNTRSGFPERCARAGRHGKPHRLGARVTSAEISRHECRANGAHSPAWGIPRERALGTMCRVTSWLHRSAFGGDVGIAHKDERACRKPPPWHCREKKIKAKSLAPSTQPSN